MSAAYERRLAEFSEGKTFTRLSRPVRNRADAHCDACGSLEPRILFGLKEKESDRYFFVGAECLRWISKRGLVERRYCKESAQVAFEHEMARRRCEDGHSAKIAQSLQEMQRFDFIPNSDPKSSSRQPQVCLWQTPESYLALVRISHQGTWVWGSAEAPRFEEVWEGHGNGEVVLKRIHRERPQAVAECAGAASEDALMKLKVVKGRRFRAPVPSGNGHHDWTRFWKTVRSFGLARDEVASFIDGLTPRDWLAEHPECSLDDLLVIVQKKRDPETSNSTADGCATIEQA